MIRLPVDLDAECVRFADADGLSMNQYVEQALREKNAMRSMADKQIAHKDGNPRNNDLDNLRVEPAPKRTRQVTTRFKRKT